MLGDLILGVLLLVFGAFIVRLGFSVQGTVRRGHTWPTVPGRVLERGLGQAMGRGTYQPRVKYAYTVDGQDYVNDQVYAIRGTGGMPSAMRRMVNRLPDPVLVHYDPQNPAQSYLLANSRVTGWFIVVFGAGAVLWGLLQVLIVLTGG